MCPSTTVTPRLRGGGGRTRQPNPPRLLLRGGADHEDNRRLGGLRSEDAPSEVKSFDERATVASDGSEDDLGPSRRPRRRRARRTIRLTSRRGLPSVISEKGSEDEPEFTQRLQEKPTGVSVRSSSDRGSPTKISDEGSEYGPGPAPSVAARPAHEQPSSLAIECHERESVRQQRSLVKLSS